MSAFLTGDKKLERIFRQLPRKVQSKIARDEIKTAVKPMAQTAKALAPRDRGDLSRAIKVRAMRRRRGHVGRSVIVDAKRLDRAGDEGASNRLAGAFQEYGFTDRSGRPVAADPFMRPAYDRHESSIRNNTTAAIGRRTIQAARAM